MRCHFGGPREGSVSKACCALSLTTPTVVAKIATKASVLSMDSAARRYLKPPSTNVNSATIRRKNAILDFVPPVLSLVMAVIFIVVPVAQKFFTAAPRKSTVVMSVFGPASVILVVMSALFGSVTFLTAAVRMVVTSVPTVLKETKYAASVCVPVRNGTVRKRTASESDDQTSKKNQ